MLVQFIVNRTFAIQEDVTDPNEGGSGDDDIETALKKEVAALKSGRNLTRFLSVDTRVKNLVFISTTVML